jgi:hypothetical protein
MEVVGEAGRVEVAAWRRPGADVGTPTFSFAAGEAGEQARAEAVRFWARGEEAVVTDGALIQFHAPQAVRDLIPDPSALAGGRLRVPAAEPVEAGLEIAGAAGTVLRRFDVRPVPPRPGAFGAVAGYAGEVLVEINFAQTDETTVVGSFSMSSHFASDARASSDAADLIYAWCTHEEATFRSAALFPDGLTGRSEEVQAEELCEEMDWRRRFYGDVVFLEDRLGRALPLPEAIGADDLNAVGTAAKVLRTGEGTASFEQTSGMVEDPLAIPRLPDEFRKQGSVRRMVTYPIFGQEVQLGFADYDLPPLRIVDIIPYGSTPTASARVVLEAEGDGQMTFRLVDWEPPAEP